MKKKILFEPKSKPKKIREWIAFRLVDIANWVRPSNEAGIAYWMGIIMESEMEAMKYGRSDIEIKLKKNKIHSGEDGKK